MAHWIGAQGRVKLAKKTQQHPPLMTSSSENPKPKTDFFSVGTRSVAKSVDGSNTSLALSTGELWLK